MKLTFFVGIMVENGGYSVSLRRDNILFLSRNEPHAILYRHADGTLRNVKGDKCLRPLVESRRPYDLGFDGKLFIYET